MSAASLAPPGAAGRPRGSAATFWVGAVLGWAVMAYGAAGLVSAARRTMPRELVLFVLGAAVIHDAVIAPVTILVGGGVIRRLVPAGWRPAVAAAFVAGAPISLFAIPFIRGEGRNPGNPSVLPGNYARGLAVTVALLAVVAAAAYRPHRRRRRPHGA